MSSANSTTEMPSNSVNRHTPRSAAGHRRFHETQTVACEKTKHRRSAADRTPSAHSMGILRRTSDGRLDRAVEGGGASTDGFSWVSSHTHSVATASGPKRPKLDCRLPSVTENRHRHNSGVSGNAEADDTFPDALRKRRPQDSKPESEQPLLKKQKMGTSREPTRHVTPQGSRCLTCSYCACDTACAAHKCHSRTTPAIPRIERTCTCPCNSYREFHHNCCMDYSPLTRCRHGSSCTSTQIIVVHCCCRSSFAGSLCHNRTGCFGETRESKQRTEKYSSCCASCSSGSDDKIADSSTKSDIRQAPSHQSGLEERGAPRTERARSTSTGARASVRENSALPDNQAAASNSTTSRLGRSAPHSERGHTLWRMARRMLVHSLKEMIDRTTFGASFVGKVVDLALTTFSTEGAEGFQGERTRTWQGMATHGLYVFLHSFTRALGEAEFFGLVPEVLRRSLLNTINEAVNYVLTKLVNRSVDQAESHSGNDAVAL